MKARFRKSFHRSVDAKGRLMLPPEYRDVIVAASDTGAFVLTGYDDCIVAYTLPEWERFEDAVYNLPNPSRALRDFRRTVLGRGEELILDPQGRVRISQALMRYAGLSREAVLLGQGNRFEIWDKARFEGLKPDSVDLDAELARSGIKFSL